jgi:hypothetical protein
MSESPEKHKFVKYKVTQTTEDKEWNSASGEHALHAASAAMSSPGTPLPSPWRKNPLSALGRALVERRSGRLVRKPETGASGPPQARKKSIQAVCDSLERRFQMRRPILFVSASVVTVVACVLLLGGHVLA